MSTELLTEERQRLRAITARIAELKGRAALVLYEMGALLSEVSERRLFEAGGFESLNAYIDAEVDLSRATAYKAIRVARHFNAGMVERYGIEKLDAGVRYMALTGADEAPGDLVAAQLRLRGEGGRFVNLPFHEASAGQVREATRLLQQSRAQAPADSRARAERVAQALKAAALGGRVTARKGRDGGALLSFRDVPVDELLAFAQALIAAADGG